MAGLMALRTWAVFLAGIRAAAALPLGAMAPFPQGCPQGIVELDARCYAADNITHNRSCTLRGVPGTCITGTISHIVQGGRFTLEGPILFEDFTLNGGNHESMGTYLDIGSRGNVTFRRCRLSGLAGLSVPSGRRASFEGSELRSVGYGPGPELQANGATLSFVKTSVIWDAYVWVNQSSIFAESSDLDTYSSNNILGSNWTLVNSTFSTIHTKLNVDSSHLNLTHSTMRFAPGAWFTSVTLDAVCPEAGSVFGSPYELDVWDSALRFANCSCDPKRAFSPGRTVIRESNLSLGPCAPAAATATALVV